jgi:hypothetical protein
MHAGLYGQRPPMQNGLYGQPPPMQNGLYGQPPPMHAGLYGQPPPMQNGLYGQPPPMHAGPYGQPPPMHAGLYGQPPPMQNGLYGQPPPMHAGPYGLAQHGSLWCDPAGQLGALKEQLLAQLVAAGGQQRGVGQGMAPTTVAETDRLIEELEATVHQLRAHRAALERLAGG